jgi:hypothetical protein
MKQPLESKRPEASVGAANVPQPVTRENKAAARKAAKTDWNAGPVFPVASDPALLGNAVCAALGVGSILDAALSLAQAGVPVFPVSSVGQKKPLNAHGVYSATIDLGVVGRDFSQHSNALIAVPMGRRTGVFAIDIDASPPHAHDGVAAWQALEANHGVTPTRIQDCERRPSSPVLLAAGTSCWLRREGPTERRRMQRRRRRDRLSALRA